MAFDAYPQRLECPLLVAKRTLTNRCLPTRFMSTRL